MLRLSFFLISFFSLVFAQTSPHGSNLKLQCDDCHSDVSWNIISQDMKFDHEITRFSLSGQHKLVNCRQCHSSLKFEEARSDCQSCHNDVHQNTLGVDCQKCHNPESWIVKNIREIHNNSRFPLVGAHQNVNCQSCHKSMDRLIFEEQNVDCYYCHRNDFEQAKNPNHITANFSTNCLLCHSLDAKSWSAKNFTHSFFPLTGGHQIKNCYACHNQQTFSGLDKKCVSCHLVNYQNTQNPNHQQVGFSTNCENCHRITTWNDAQFDHDNFFFPIYSGKHKGKWNSCIDCHTNSSNYSEFSCINCHEHNKPKMDDKHGNVNGYVYNSRACLNCHPSGSKEGAFNHGLTNFPLTGAHINLNCNSCHNNGFQNTSAECQACHLGDFNQTQNPNHQQIGFSTQCKNCHTTIAWIPSTFNHNNTQFPLTGAHINVSCLNCHQGQTTGTSTFCYDCHQNQYNQTTNPSHTTLNLPTTCNTCHSTNPRWRPALFPIHNNYYPLTGQHNVIRNNCDACHNGNYNTTPNQCQGCHIDNYNRTINPNHVRLQFPYQCDMCHTTNGWIPSTFNHDQQYFPIFSGKHKNKWDNCSICHINPNNFSDFSCITCHEHNKTRMDDKHRDVNGYVYNSQACLNCHPTGEGLIHIKKFIHD
jgi:Zn finger protein HypA/HybF involved in hydrogenase expression